MRYPFLLIGILSLILGIIGIFLPILPTTPFLLLAAYLFSKSSPEFHEWLINHPKLGVPINDWNKNRVIRTQFKVLATIMLAIPTSWLIYKGTLPQTGLILYLLFIAALLLFLWSQKGDN